MLTFNEGEDSRLFSDFANLEQSFDLEVLVFFWLEIDVNEDDVE